MTESYGISIHNRVPPGNIAERFRSLKRALISQSGDQAEVLHVTRLVGLMMVVLLLTFGTVYKLTDAAGANSFWPEMSLAVVTLGLLAASLRTGVVQRYLARIVQGLSYVTAGWFIVLAALNGFSPNYAVGLLFIIPGLGVGHSMVTDSLASSALFIGINTVLATVVSLSVGSGLTPHLFVASLICISLVTLFVVGARVSAQRLFHASEERYRAVVEQASDGIYMLDAKTFQFRDANRAFCRLVGLTPPQLKHLRVQDLIVADPDEASDWTQGIEEGGRIIELTLRRSDGSSVVVEMHVDRITFARGEMLSVVVHDISARKEYESRLVKAKNSAEEIARFKSSLLANMSHEIRTPLSSILGWTTVLNDELPDKHRELVRLIADSGQRLHATLDSVLELAHLHANVRKLKPVRIDLRAEVEAAVESARPRAASNGLDLVVDCDEEEVWMKTDGACLRRALGHLIDNAIKFTHAGSIAVEIRRSGDDVRIDVEDTGIGITPNFIPQIFEEFKQESAGLSRNHEGSGLGLSIARNLTELLNGEITVESALGVGSTFSIRLPMGM